MTSVLYKLIPDNKRLHPLRTYTFTFLNEIDKYINVDDVYKLFTTTDEYKLLNIYHFLFIRSIKINSEFSEIPTLTKETKRLSDKDINQLLYNYIGIDKVKALVILNGILCYFYPNINY
jgi:hypothetical protein